jgi:hypothetical protein
VRLLAQELVDALVELAHELGVHEAEVCPLARAAARTPGGSVEKRRRRQLGQPGGVLLPGQVFLPVVREVATTPRGTPRTGWLAGLGDPHVSRALSLLHRDMAPARRRVSASAASSGWRRTTPEESTKRSA